MTEPMDESTIEFFFRQGGEYHLVVYRNCDMDDENPTVEDDFSLEDLYQAFKARLLNEVFESVGAK